MLVNNFIKFTFIALDKCKTVSQGDFMTRKMFSIIVRQFCKYIPFTNLSLEMKTHRICMRIVCQSLYVATDIITLIKHKLFMGHDIALLVHDADTVGKLILLRGKCKENRVNRKSDPREVHNSFDANYRAQYTSVKIL